MRLRTSLIVPALIFALPCVAQSPSASSASVSAQFRLTEKAEVPGSSLSPGTYTIRVADKLNDRVIVQVQKNGSGKGVTFLAYPNAALSATGSGGPVVFGSGLKGKETLRGFSFQNGPTVEFVYPKSDAVSLAKSNEVKVMAVDPASENRPALKNLSQTDLDEVTLWMLTPTPVGPGDQKAGIQAARYQAPSAAPEPQQASAPAPAPQPAYSQPAAAAPVQNASIAPSHVASKAPVQVASNTRPHIRPAVQQLPHTASFLPLVWLAGLVSFLTAGVLSVRRSFGRSAL